ncbi:MAG: hypothetical protein ACR2K6_10125, partial [Solirubrobacterales bacterium]
PVVLDEEHCRAIAASGEARIDVNELTVTYAEGVVPFEIEEEIHQRLLAGNDEIDMTMKRGDEIDAFEADRDAFAGRPTTELAGA